MYQRIIAAVAGSLFALLAVVAGVMTDLHDRSYPHELGASSSLYLDFSRTGLADARAFDDLTALSGRWHLGLVRILPRLAGDTDGQVLVPLGPDVRALPDRVHWYGGQPTGVVRGRDAVAHSFATGQYLVTGSTDHLDDAERALLQQGVLVRRVDDTFWQSASFLVRQAGFRTTLVAALALMVSMALFWLSVRSRGRALRVLGGVSARRIQVEDLGRLAIAASLPVVPVTALAGGVVVAQHGTRWLRYYLLTLGGLEVGVVAVTVVAALAMSAASWPGVRMLATRQPVVRGLNHASTTLKVVAFVLVLLTAGPAWWAFGDARDAAAQQARWRSLSDQVALRFPAGLGEKGFVQISGKVGGVVADADAAGDAALSYAMAPADLNADGGSYDSIALVNAAWLRLMDVGPDLRENSSLLRPVDRATLPADLVAGVRANLDVWARARGAGGQLWSSLAVATPRSDVQVPLAAGGNGDLVFPHHPLVLLVPDVATFNDDFLASLTSTNNLVLSGLDPTLALLRSHGLDRTIQVKYAAEDGVLRAQFAAYEAWLRGFALAALSGAFVLALAISAFIAALLHARRDFPLRLDGRAWAAVLRPRVGRELGVGVVLGAVVLLGQPPTSWAPTVIALCAALAGTALAHLVAARWCFQRVADRTV